MKHKCAAHGRNWCYRCVLITVTFPIEHLIWEKAPYLRMVTVWLGL